MAPADFGTLSNAVLIGNFGDGKINAYDPTTGTFMMTAIGSNGAPLVIDGLWSLVFGPDTPGAAHNQLFFTAGPNMETTVLKARLRPLTRRPGRASCRTPPRVHGFLTVLISCAHVSGRAPVGPLVDRRRAPRWGRSCQDVVHHAVRRHRVRRRGRGGTRPAGRGAEAGSQAGIGRRGRRGHGRRERSRHGHRRRRRRGRRPMPRAVRCA